MSTSEVATALGFLQQPVQLTLLTLSEPILSSRTDAKRSSNVSSSDGSTDNISPAALQADLSHYKELFSKLRFSYVEQVTKERFLKAIVADPPEVVDKDENAALEQKLATDKAALKAKKEEVRTMIQELESSGRGLARRHELLQLQTTQLQTLPAEIENLDATIATLRQAQVAQSDDPELNLSLDDTAALIAEREERLAELNREVDRLRAALPEKVQQVAALEDELKPLERRKRMAIEQAQEAQRKRGKGGMADECERRGRWLKGAEQGLRTMLEV